MAELLDLCDAGLSERLTDTLRQRLAPLHGSDVTDYLGSEEGELLLRTISVVNRSRLHSIILDN